MAKRLKYAFLVSALLTLPAAAVAQNELTEQASEVTEQAQQLQNEADELANMAASSNDVSATTLANRDRDDDDGFDWGLLGLLGLAGLLGLKRDRNHHHANNIHPDRRL